MTTIFKTKADVDTLQELRRRKRQLSAKIKTERAELKHTMQEIKEDFTPARIVKNTLDAFRRPSDDGLLSALLFNPATLRLATDFALTVLMRNPRGARVLRVVAPAVIQALPGVVRFAKKFWSGRKEKKAAKRKRRAAADLTPAEQG